MRKPLSHDGYLKKLNREMQKHPNFIEGMRVEKIDSNLYEMTIPGVDAKNPDDIKKLKGDVALQMVLWDSIAIIDKTYSYTDARISEKMLPNSMLFRSRKEGRCSVLLQSMFKNLYDCIIAYKHECGSWPADVTPLIEKHRIKDPWDTKEFLKVKYTAPADTADHQQVLAEYIKEGKRKFTLYIDGHQETWKI